LAQSRQVARALEELHDGLTVELVPLSTAGDRHEGPLHPVGGKGLFTQELEDGLLSGSLDLAVHSLKDLPAELPQGLTLAAFPPREDPRDTLITDLAGELDDLPPGARVLTGSLRRGSQVLARRPDLVVVPIRGNVPTRIRRWKDGEGDAVVLAAAGLRRLALEDDLPCHHLDPETLLPAPGQGILGLEVKAGGLAETLCYALNHEATALAAAAERAVVAQLGGDCTLPIGALWDGSGPRLTALIASPDGARLLRVESVHPDPEQAARECVQALLKLGAQEVVDEIHEGKA
jgi:hydroxymethylbilane synthase